MSSNAATTLAPSTATVSTVVAAPVEAVWAIVSDPTRYAELSPENVGADVEGDLAVGATFSGRNARDGNEWTTPCTVTELEPQQRFAFFAGDEETGTSWSFRVRDLGEAGTQVTQSFDSNRLRHPEWVDVLPGRHAQLVEDMQATLAAVKRMAEEGVK